MNLRHPHVIGFDDAPFAPEHRGDVPLVGAVCCGLRLEGVLVDRVRRDGANATARIADMIERSRFLPQLQAILLQGIAVAGFNVIDIRSLHQRLGLPVVVISRRAPDMDAIRRALLERVPGGKRKWRLIERAGPVEPMSGVYVQRVGIEITDTKALIRALAVNSRIPEPLRTAHLIAGGLANGESRHPV